MDHRFSKNPPSGSGALPREGGEREEIDDFNNLPLETTFYFCGQWANGGSERVCPCLDLI